MPRASSSPIADFRSLENGRLRTSTTTAILGTAPLARRARSIIVGSRSGGRLSATNQSRSSSDFAAVLLPAPDIPVMITISGARLAVVTIFLPRWQCLPRCQCLRPAGTAGQAGLAGAVTVAGHVAGHTDRTAAAKRAGLASRGGGAALAGLPRSQRGKHRLRQPRPDAGQAGDLRYGSAADPADGAEMAEQRGPPGRPKARH